VGDVPGLVLAGAIEVRRTIVGVVAVASGDDADLAVGLEENEQSLLGAQQLVLTECDRELAVADAFLAKIVE
jgi:hypothetical protein